jgi:hypothetical protein
MASISAYSDMLAYFISSTNDKKYLKSPASGINNNERNRFTMSPETIPKLNRIPNIMCMRVSNDSE